MVFGATRVVWCRHCNIVVVQWQCGSGTMRLHKVAITNTLVLRGGMYSSVAMVWYGTRREIEQSQVTKSFLPGEKFYSSVVLTLLQWPCTRFEQKFYVYSLANNQ